MIADSEIQIMAPIQPNVGKFEITKKLEENFMAANATTRPIFKGEEFEKDMKQKYYDMFG